MTHTPFATWPYTVINSIMERIKSICLFFFLHCRVMNSQHVKVLSMWTLTGGKADLAEPLLGWLQYMCVFSNQTGTITSQQDHLNTSSCPSYILLMALSPINKACSWLLDAACLPACLARSFTPPCFTICMRTLACLQTFSSMNN